MKLKEILKEVIKTQLEVTDKKAEKYLKQSIYNGEGYLLEAITKEYEANVLEEKRMKKICKEANKELAKEKVPFKIQI